MITPLFSLLREQGISYGVIISHCERTHESDLELTPFYLAKKRANSFLKCRSIDK